MLAAPLLLASLLVVSEDGSVADLVRLGLELDTRNYPLTDDQLAEALQAPEPEPEPEETVESFDFLTADALAGRGIAVHDEDGILTLTGQVNSQAARRHVISAADRAPGTRAVIDRLVVVESSRTNDERMVGLIHFLLSEYAELRDLLANSHQFKRTRFEHPPKDPVQIEVEDGVVRLLGTVRSEDEKALAEAVVAATRGVFALDSRLEVDPDLRLPSKDERHVQDMFFY